MNPLTPSILHTINPRELLTNQYQLIKETLTGKQTLTGGQNGVESAGQGKSITFVEEFSPDLLFMRSTVRILGAEFSDFGLYICNFTNSIDSDSVSINLQPKAPTGFVFDAIASVSIIALVVSCSMACLLIVFMPCRGFNMNSKCVKQAAGELLKVQSNSQHHDSSSTSASSSTSTSSPGGSGKLQVAAAAATTATTMAPDSGDDRSSCNQSMSQLNQQEQQNVTLVLQQEYDKVNGSTQSNYSNVYTNPLHHHQAHSIMNRQAVDFHGCLWPIASHQQAQYHINHDLAGHYQLPVVNSTLEHQQISYQQQSPMSFHGSQSSICANGKATTTLTDPMPTSYILPMIPTKPSDQAQFYAHQHMVATSDAGDDYFESNYGTMIKRAEMLGYSSTTTTKTVGLTL